jgi:hypothetical protein
MSSSGAEVSSEELSATLAIPCSAIAGGYGGVAGLVVTWVGIVAVNVAAAFPFHRSR